MTFPATEIQTLIADIDALLANSGKRLSRSLFQKGNTSGNDANPEPRQILERVRSLLVELNEGEALNTADTAHSSPLLAKLRGENLPSPLESSPVAEVIAPLRAEIQALLTERQGLVAEIRELEQQRLHNHSLAQQLANQEQTISEFLRVLVNRVETQLPSSNQVLSGTPVIPPSPQFNLNNHLDSGTNTHESAERLAMLTQELDRRLLALDGTVNVVFDALQRNVQTYCESLSQNLKRMHDTGIQGEEVLINLINNLTQTFQLPSQRTKLIDPETAKTDIDAVFSMESSQETPIKPVYKSNQVNLDRPSPSGANTPETPDLDALLLELSRDLDVTPSNTSNQPKNSKNSPGNDAIDALYAGLLTTDAASGSKITSNSPTKLVASDQPIVDEIVTPNPEPSTDTSQDILHQPINGVDEIEAVLAEQQGQQAIVIPEPADHIPTVSEELATIESSGSGHEELVDDTQATLPGEVEQSAHATEPTNLELFVESTPKTVSENISQSAQDLYPAVTLDPNLAIKITPSVSESQTSASKLLSDPWFDEADAGLLGTVEAETRIEEEEEEVSDDVQPNGLLSEPPHPSDTIYALTDLQIDGAAPTYTHNTTTVSKPDIEIAQPVNPTKTRSPREDLIAQATASLDLDAIIPEISLDPQQQAQLHADLSKFEAQPSIPLLTETPTEEKKKQANFPIPPAPSVLAPNPEQPRIGDTQITPLPEPEIISISQSDDGDNAEDNTADAEETVWYLGIDIGTTGISAALLNRTSTEIYPIYWSADNDIDISSSKRTFRLPAEVYLPTLANTIEPSRNQEPKQQSIHFTAQLKPYLQIALPYRNDQNAWEPNLQLNEAATVPLAWIVRSLSKLFLTLKADKQSTTLGLTASATGLSTTAFSQIITNISGVICNYPANWSEQYRFNIREALLIAKIIPHPQAVFFVEEAIASLICELDGANGEDVYTHTDTGIKRTRNPEAPILGNTLSMNLGASSTEMSLVDVPENLLELAHSDFILHSFAYAGKGIEQDIICQLLLPDKWRQSRLDKTNDINNITSAPWHWQPTITGLEQTRLSSLRWEEISLPHPGEPDLNERIQLQKRLETYPLGQALLDVASAIKLILQHQETFTFELADQRWLLYRRDLESQVFVPFVRRLNRELNRLLVTRGIPTEAIDQVIINGGVANLTAVNRWLRQKLPNAKIIQEAYLNENNTPDCSRVAYGLTLLPLHPQILDIPRQQYTDYFLFTELLRLLPEHPIAFGEIINLFEAKGINTRTCQQRILAFLEGEIPAGVIPGSIDSLWLTDSSLESNEYRSITATPLFTKQGSLSYAPNLEQVQILRRYLDKIQTSNQQSLEEPYTVNFALGIPIN